MVSNTIETFTCKVNFQLLYYVEFMLKLMSTSFLNFQSTLACLGLEVNILISCESKVKISSFFFWKLGQRSNPESWQWIMLQGCPNHTADLWKSVTEPNLWKTNPPPHSNLTSFLLICLFNVPNSQHHFEKNFTLLLNPPNVSVCFCLSL